MAREPARTPKPPAAPRLAGLAEGRIGPDDFAADRSVQGLVTRDFFADAISVEFGEFGTCRVQGGSASGSDWHRSRWHDLELCGVDLANMALTDSMVERVLFRNCRLTGAHLGGTTLADVTFENCVLDLASLHGATLRRVQTMGGRWNQVDLTEAVVIDGSWHDATLQRARLGVRTANRMRLERCQLDAATGWDRLRGVELCDIDHVAVLAAITDELGISVIDGDAKH